MKVKKTPMPLFQKIVYIASAIFMFVAFIYLGTKDYNVPVKDFNDQENFTKDFGITNENIYDYKTASEILEIMNTGTGVIFFAFPENVWSHTYACLLNDVAKYYGLNEIYYYNFFNDRIMNNSYYENIVKKLNAYLPVLDNGTRNIYAPSMIMVKNGEIIAYDDETSILHGDVTVDDYWTYERQENKRVQLGVYFEKFLEEENET